MTSDEILASQPETLIRFLRAALRGIDYARQHPDEAVQAMLEYTGPETDPEQMCFMLESELVDAISPLTEQPGLGWQNLEQWQALAEMLQQYDASPRWTWKKPSRPRFFRSPQIHDPARLTLNRSSKPPARSAAMVEPMVN